MPLSMIEYKVLCILPRGNSNPISTNDIKRATGVSVRKIRDAVSILINNYGVPVVAKRTGKSIGMYIATNETERRLGLLGFRSQLDTMNARLYAIEHADLNGWEQAIQPSIAKMMREATEYTAS